VRKMFFRKISILTDPRKFMGEISARYIGVSPALSPELIPMIKRPMMISSYDEYIFETPKHINEKKLIYVCQ